MPLSEVQAATAIGRILQGSPVKRVASSLNVHRATLYRRLKAFEQEGRLARKPIKRKDKLSEREKNGIRNYVSRNVFSSRENIRENLKLSICNSTLTKYLGQMQLRSGISPKKFSIEIPHREERIRVANSRLQWEMDTWRHYIFTDESGLDNSGAIRKRVWRPKNKRFDPTFVHYSDNKSFRLNFFSWVSCFGTGDIYFYDKMDSTLYCEIVSDMVNSLKEQFGDQMF